ncbi:MAG: hypothetical protein Q8L14_15625 [Myxococcales bacterium]|nr:hypothetical protein [Myxococcales bacterium]
MKIICVSGADGCGKSTLLTSLAEALPGASVVSIWDLMRDPRARPLYATKEQIQTFLGALEEESRALFMLSYLRAAMDRAAPGVVLVDAYWYKYLANELALGAAPARLLPLTALFEKPMLTIHLELAPAIAAARKQGVFSAYECGLQTPTAERFIEFQSRTGPLQRELVERDSRQVVRLDGAAPASAIFERALACIHEALASQNGVSA